MERWTSEQSLILNQPIQNTVIFAGPGSGKTTVFTAFLAHQLDNRQIYSDQTMAVTFTRKSAQSMMSKLTGQIQHKQLLKKLRIGTFHGQFFRFILPFVKEMPVLLKSHEERKLIESALRKLLPISQPFSTQLIDDAVQIIMRMKSRYPIHGNSQFEMDLLEMYEKNKSVEKRWDFEDILLFSLFLFTHSKSFQDVMRKWEFIMVDEFQDTNNIQWHVLNELIKISDAKLFVVGDDDQAIYSFRGSSSYWLLHLDELIPNTSKYFLQYNFRSDIDICKYSSNIIEKQSHRSEKIMIPTSSMYGNCAAVTVKNEEEEYYFIEKLLLHFFSLKKNMSIAILARTRRELIPFIKLIPKYYSRHFYLTVCTFHEAKGLEWDVVFLLGAVEKNPFLRNVDSHILIPTRDNQNLTSEDDEERRLFFVACTRAKHVLITFFPQCYGGKKMNISPYLLESQMSIH
ncbi:UvrD-helicase domain-containing protein [Alicyclobacillus tolerans]|uniref:UvrD-helicase domain-containing protein n=1 Tax=Alicyclobacillus tolerans TaxID=90970 RepID=UPI003B7FB48D